MINPNFQRSFEEQVSFQPKLHLTVVPGQVSPPEMTLMPSRFINQ